MFSKFIKRAVFVDDGKIERFEFAYLRRECAKVLCAKQLQEAIIFG